MATPVKLDIIIVGAGPAGCTAAAALAQQGHRVTVLERSASLQTGGGGVYLQAPAVTALEHLGLAEKLAAKATKLGGQVFWWYKDIESGPRATIPASPHINSRMLRRAEVQQLAYDAAIEAGATVLFGVKVERLQETDGSAAVWTTDGREHRGDLVVGVDGLKSTVRRYMFPGTDVEPLATRECIFQSYLSKEVVESDVEGFKFVTGEGQGSAHSVMSQGRFCIFIPDRHGGMSIICTEFDYGPPENDPVNASWNNEADTDELRALFAEYAPRFRAPLEHVKKGMRWRIARAKRLDTWRSKEGKVLLLGDAAHAMLPNAGQGLSQGIEDGVALAETLKYLNSDKSNLSELLERFEKFRRPRAIKFWEQSEELMKRHLLPEGPAQMERFEVYNKVGQGVKMLNASAIDWEEVQMDMEKPMHTLEFQKFLLKYDVIKELHRFMEAN